MALLGKSPKEGYWLLYPTLDMSQSVEINEADIVHPEQLLPDRSPFGSLGGTQVLVKATASVTTSKTISVVYPANEPADEFDLDVELGTAVTPAVYPYTKAVTCQTCKTNCSPTCPVKTCITCATCQTRCGTCVAMRSRTTNLPHLREYLHVLAHNQQDTCPAIAYCR